MKRSKPFPDGERSKPSSLKKSDKKRPKPESEKGRSSSSSSSSVAVAAVADVSEKKRSKKTIAPSPALQDSAWDLSVTHGNRYVSVSQVRDRPEALAKIAARPLGEEVTRHWTVNNLRTELAKCCEGLTVPAHLFEHWLFACNLDPSFQILKTKLADFDMDEEKNVMQDVLVPFVDLGIAELSRLLREAGLDDAAIKTVTEKFQPELKISVRAMHVAMMKDPSKRIEVELRREHERMIVGKVVLPLAPRFRAKLFELYRRFASPTGEGFDENLAIALLRYDALKGPGFQAGLPPAVFEVLKKDFGVFMECFASPFNCYFPRYCSMFTDDFALGSLGSFFQFRPLDGSFLAFPPSTLLVAALRHIEDLLILSNRALNFIIVAHGKDVVAADKELQASPRFVHRQIIPAKEHALTNGFAYRKSEGILKLAVAPTYLYWLQNEAGTKRWPVDEEKTARIAIAFAGKKNASDNAAAVAAAVAATIVEEEKVEDVQKVSQEPVSSNWKSLKKKLKKKKE